MRHFLITLLTLLAATAASAATTTPPEGYTYRPLVEEGKRWTYVVPQPYAEENNLDIFKIEGDTIFQDATWKKLWFLDENEKSILPFPVALLREENKLVYMYPLWNASNEYDVYDSLVEDKGKHRKELFRYLVFNDGRERRPTKEEIDETYPIVLYDFNLNPGGKFDSPMFWPWGFSPWENEEIIVGGYEEYASDYTRYIEFSIFSNPERICDGRGYIGDMFFICPFPMWTLGTGIFSWAELGYSPELQSVTTSDGQDLYRSDIEKGLKSPNWLNENYVWVYESREEGVLTERFYRLDGKENVLYKVDETTGKEYRHSYHRLILSREKRSQVREDGTLSVISDTEMSEPVAYMDIANDSPMGLEEIMVRFRTGDEISPEAKLYDWFPRISKEDLKFPVPGSDRSLYEKINSRGRLTRDDYEFEVFWAYPTSKYQNENDGIPDDFYPRPIVKGIGNCGFGLLHDVGSEEALKFRFSRLTDREGNVIVTSEDIQKLKPVPESVETVAESNPIRIYGDRVEAVSADGAAVTLTVVSADGRTVAQTSGKGSVTLYTDQLPQGVFVVRCESDGNADTIKIVK